MARPQWTTPRLLILLIFLVVLVVSDQRLIELVAVAGIVLVWWSGIESHTPLVSNSPNTTPIPTPAMPTDAPVIGRGQADIIDNIADYVAIVDEAGRLAYVNRAGRALIGTEPIEKIPAAFFMPQWALDSIGKPPDPRFANGAWQADTEIHLMDEIHIPVAQVIIAHVDGAGRVNQLATICRDRLDQRFVEESAMRLMVQGEKLKAMQEMIAHFTHDLRAPLTSIVTGLFLAERQTQNPERVQARFDAIREQTRLLEMMIQDVLTYSRFEVVPALNRQTVDLVEMLDKIRQNLAPQMEGKGIDFKLIMPTTACEISGDADGLNRLFSNLIENAVKYSRENGEVLVHLLAQDDWMTVAIRDTGIGIDGAEVPRIFEQFFRASSAKEAGIVGTGVGLAIVRRVADLHGGTVEVQSELGQGTTFTVRLPVAGNGS
ncbi:MAG: HAMP domain-containing histidine kinase [Anaerolineae bacterium]|nr:HAMP domain-containing histidine kinase [Anaerolineae bacterium]